ncbi:hypothetical protein ACWFRB_06975 [Rhodococcus sp. NPDC055112]
MNGKNLARRTTAAFAIGATATLVFAGTAGADPQSDGIQDLRKAAANSEANSAAVDVLVGSPLVTTNIASSFGLFAFTSPTIGCGPGVPITLTGASASSGGDLKTGQIRFQASPRVSGVAKGSGLTAVWVNTSTGASGIAPIDGVTEFGTPSLSKVVDSGPGNVAAALFGTVTYADATCVVLPTVGMFTVAAPAGTPAK